MFRFKKFSIIQEKSAMKVGTDAVLLGSWTSCKKANNILDVGCGTGIIALMLAQRNLNSNITGIDIDEITAKEAQLNINNSDWKERVKIKHISLQNFVSKKKFDLIVSNPPFFPKNKSDDKRNIARHKNKLLFKELIEYSVKLLEKTGRLSIIIPTNAQEGLSKIAMSHQLYCERICYIKGHNLSKVKRVMLEFSFIKTRPIIENLVVEKSRHAYTKEYINLCKDFYLDM